MLNLMQNYGIFTKITILHESMSKEAKRAIKCASLTKAGSKKGHDTSTYLAT